MKSSEVDIPNRVVDNLIVLLKNRKTYILKPAGIPQKTFIALIRREAKNLGIEIGIEDERKFENINVTSSGTRKIITVKYVMGYEEMAENGKDSINISISGKDSKIFEEWIAHCIRKHVKGGVEPILTKEQCIRAAFKKLRAGELSKRGKDSVVIVYDSATDKVDIIEIKDG